MAGAPTKYKGEETCLHATKLAALGLTDKEMASFFEVSESTFNLWKEKHPEFSESLKGSKQAADNRVVQALYSRALGYTVTEERITKDGGVVETKKQYPPDTTACIFWLKNRDRENWRDKHEVGHTDAEGKDVKQDDLLTVAKKVAYMLNAGVSEVSH